MKKHFLIQVVVFLLMQQAKSQSTNYDLGVIEIAESTLKIQPSSQEEFLYAFAAGDQLIFNLEVLDGKELKEFEILEYPSSSKYMDYKVQKINEKKISITKTGIYKFRFKNTNIISGRVCKYKIQRVPKSGQTKDFNSSVYWKVQYDTTFWFEDVRYLVSRDTSISPTIPLQIVELKAKPGKDIVKVPLPLNTIAWSFYIGVGKDAEDIFQKAEEKAKRKKDRLTTASSLVSKAAYVDPTGSAALASLVLSGLAEFGTPAKADNVKYWIVENYENASLFMLNSNFLEYESGNGPLCTKRVLNPVLGNPYICLYNDNLFQTINVYVRISALTVNEKWGVRKEKKFSVKSTSLPYFESN